MKISEIFSLGGCGGRGHGVVAELERLGRVAPDAQNALHLYGAEDVAGFSE